MSSIVSDRSLPSPESLDLASYKAGSLISDLAGFVDRVHGLTASSLSWVEYEQRKEEGTLPPEQPLDRDWIAEIVVFAAEVLEDAKAIPEYAEQLLREALALRREETSREEIDAYYQHARKWHLAEAERRVGEAS
jgi:hypothetical protein